MFAKDGQLVRDALKVIEARLPFPLLALYCDNGSEFMNHDVVDRFAKTDRLKPIDVFRSMPYRKNDQCYVEQKNYNPVRKLFGYGRIDSKVGVNLMNNIYSKEWRQLQNFFMPQQKLISKRRLGAKIKRKMGYPNNPV